MTLSMRQLERTGVCSACGYDVRLHYDGQRMVGCAGAVRLAPVDRGRLLQVKLARNAHAREEARTTIRQGPGSTVEVKLGGRAHGTWYRFPNRVSAEQAVDAHYNDLALQLVIDNKKEPPDGHIERGTEATSPE